MKSYLSFLFHLALVLLAWCGPFLFSWYLMVVVYTLVFLQFVIFEKCLLNATHGLLEEKDPDATFYAELLEAIGFRINRKPLKRFVRTWLYPLLALFTILLQCILNWNPILF